MVSFGAFFQGKIFYLIVILGAGVLSLTTVIVISQLDTESPAELPSEPPTQPPTEPPTEAPTEPPTEPPFEPPTQKEILNLYPLNNQYIGYYDSESKEVETNFVYQTIIIMDRSGSMGTQALRLVQRIFPLFLQKLSYQPTNEIKLITFDSIGELYTVTVGDLSKLPITARGGTLMTQAVKLCQDVFGELNSKLPARLLTISDGIIGDQPSTAAQAILLRDYLNGLDPKFLINSNAVRLFTSSAQPDITAISSLLQINNGPSNSLQDINASETDDAIANKIADLFMTDNFDRLKTLRASKQIFREFPWDDQLTSELKLSPGENLFWITELPADGFDDDGKPANSVTNPQLNADGFEVLIRTRFHVIVERIKVLQILNSVDADASIEKIKNYFKDTLDTLTVGRRSISNMAVFNLIETLANDQSVKTMSQQEKAAYLLTKIVLPELEVV